MDTPSHDILHQLVLSCSFQSYPPADFKVNFGFQVKSSAMKRKSHEQMILGGGCLRAEPLLRKMAWEQKNKDQRLPESKAHAKSQVPGTRKRDQNAVAEEDPCQLRWLQSGESIKWDVWTPKRVHVVIQPAIIVVAVAPQQEHENTSYSHNKSPRLINQAVQDSFFSLPTFPCGPFTLYSVQHRLVL